MREGDGRDQMQRECPGWSRPLHPILQERCEYLIDESPRLRDDAVAIESTANVLSSASHNFGLPRVHKSASSAPPSGPRVRPP